MSLFLVLVLRKRRGVKKVGNCTGNEILRFFSFELPYLFAYKPISAIMFHSFSCMMCVEFVVSFVVLIFRN